MKTKHNKTIKSRMKRMWGNDEYGICEVFANERNGGGLITTWDKKRSIYLIITRGTDVSY